VKLSEVRLFFDECLPRAMLVRLAEFVKPETGECPVLRHLLDFESQGTFDEVWIPQIKGEDWTVISADGGRQPNKNRGKKLPCLCAEYGITLIILSPVVHARKAFDKARTIISVWEQIVDIATDPTKRGGRFMLEPLSQSAKGNQGIQVALSVQGTGRIFKRPIQTQAIESKPDEAAEPAQTSDEITPHD